ncbi:HNH endonuclease [Sphingobacterium oryzagri]|uniref:HNH endonuclease n=1 Tax=Sphingobacterium oryzagri TaxID=3025669 RepID=A0ABY7WJ29_9SPHI|nr:HNH endonuclease [Sphingobacterium sp. KACC 22765]WDF69601.1 HNH endonuclease [Sphingobacterium sp. KACC 22765]
MNKAFQKISIDDVDYYIVDSIQNLRAEDSFIFNKNKLRMFDGSGEARKYVGSYKGASGIRLSEFFEYDKWGDTKVNGIRTYPIIQNSCFFSKSNLLKYLYDSRIEYFEQEQLYHNDISKYYDDYLKEVMSLEFDKNFFSIYDVSDFVDNKLSRSYIRSDDKIWSMWRHIVLPKISYLSILKLLPVVNDQLSINPKYYFRVFLDYQFRSIVHPQLDVQWEEVAETLVENKVKKLKSIGRIGAEIYRKKVIDHMPQCPFTKITDEKLLIASHIKPYRVCIKEGNEEEAVDYLNGLALTPTYDKLFDQGYITFKDNGDLVCGTLLSPYTWEKLNINPTAKNNMRIYPENRGKYLDYHRKFVFQDNYEDLV